MANGGANTYTTVANTVTKTTHAAPGLPALAGMFFRVRTVATIGAATGVEGDWSVPVMLFHARPTAPTTVTQNGYSTTSIVIEWNASVDNGSAVTKYTGQYGTNQQSTRVNIPTKYETASGAERTLTHTGTTLTVDTVWYYFIAGTNAAGLGTGSSGTGLISATLPSAPGAITQQYLTNTSTSIEAKWVASTVGSGAPSIPVTSYTL